MKGDRSFLSSTSTVYFHGIHLFRECCWEPGRQKLYWVKDAELKLNALHVSLLDIFGSMWQAGGYARECKEELSFNKSNKSVQIKQLLTFALFQGPWVLRWKDKGMTSGLYGVAIETRSRLKSFPLSSSSFPTWLAHHTHFHRSQKPENFIFLKFTDRSPGVWSIVSHHI